MLATVSPAIGYDRAAEIAKESLITGKSIREIALNRKVLPKEELDRILDPKKMTGVK